MKGTWRRIRRIFELGGDDEPALVPNRPRRPILSDAVALPLPEEPQDVNARGRESD